jgi:hypothetical protein
LLFPAKGHCNTGEYSSPAKVRVLEQQSDGQTMRISLIFVNNELRITYFSAQKQNSTCVSYICGVCQSTDSDLRSKKTKM